MKPSEPAALAPPQLLTVQEVAAQLRVSTVTVRRMLAGGDLRGYRIGRSVRIPRDAVTELLSQ